MITLPLNPYHKNIRDFWVNHNDLHMTDNFWVWIKAEYKAEMDFRAIPERWKFENEQDAMWFALRWS